VAGVAGHEDGSALARSQLADERFDGTLENAFHDAGAKPAARVGRDLDQNAIAVHGGTDAAAGERDRRAAVFGDDERCAAVAAAHAPGDEPHALGERDPSFAGANDLPTRLQSIDCSEEIGTRNVEAVGQAVDDEVLALRAVQTVEELVLEVDARAQTNTGG